MDFYECLQTRRSVRKFVEKPVDNQTLEQVVANAAYAPSWKNAQPTRYIAITDKALKSTIADQCMLGFAPNKIITDGAPVLMIVTYIEKRSGFERDGTPSTSKGSHWESFDTGIAAQSFCLSAWNEGLGTVIMGLFDEDLLIKIAGIPDGQRIAALVAVGYPAETPVMPRRKGVSDLLTYR